MGLHRARTIGNLRRMVEHVERLIARDRRLGRHAQVREGEAELALLRAELIAVEAADG